MELNSFRLQSDSMFVRSEEINPIKPLSIICLAVEGNVTEPNYFLYIEKYREQLGAKKGLHIKVLEREVNDNYCTPSAVLDLLQEYVDLCDEEKASNLIRSFIPGHIADEYIKQYIEGQVEDDEKKEELEGHLREIGFPAEYYAFMREYKSECGDVFGIVIDRDHYTHSIAQLNRVLDDCEKNGYKFFMTNPCFEFWLLLHVCDVKNNDDIDLAKCLVNDKVSNQHSYTSKKLNSIVQHGKNISEDQFVKYYLNNIDTAIMRIKDFNTEINELIGDEKNPMGRLGSNLGNLFDIFRS